MLLVARRFYNGPKTTPNTASPPGIGALPVMFHCFTTPQLRPLLRLPPITPRRRMIVVAASDNRKIISAVGNHLQVPSPIFFFFFSSFLLFTSSSIPARLEIGWCVARVSGSLVVLFLFLLGFPPFLSHARRMQPGIGSPR